MINNIKYTSFIERVFNELNKINISTLEYCMRGGLGEYLLAISKLEDVLGLSLNGEKKGELFNRLNIFLMNLNQDIHHIPNDDELGMLLSIGNAAYKSSLLNNAYFVNIVGRIINSHFHHPLKLKSLYYPGLLALIFWEKEDNLFRYSCEEKMLLLLRDCEDIVENSLNNHAMASYSILHSILHYLEKCRDNHIGTYKSQILIDKISKKIGIHNECNRLIDYLVVQDALSNLSHCNDAEILSYIGFFSMLYDYPNPLFLEGKYNMMISGTPSHQQYIRIAGGLILGLLKNFAH